MVGVDDDDGVAVAGYLLGQEVTAVHLLAVGHECGVVTARVDDALLAEQHGAAPGVEDDEAR